MSQVEPNALKFTRLRPLQRRRTPKRGCIQISVSAVPKSEGHIRNAALNCTSVATFSKHLPPRKQLLETPQEERAPVVLVLIYFYTASLLHARGFLDEAPGAESTGRAADDSSCSPKPGAKKAARVIFMVVISASPELTNSILSV